MTKEPSKDFRQALLDIIACPICLKQMASCTLCLDEVTRILALCKEMLVPEDIQEEPNHSEHQVSYAIGWNACKSVLLKQLGEK